MDNPLILVVDDDPVQRFVAQKQLQKLGCDSKVAFNGQQAIEATVEATFALILMDVQMPVMDGLEATMSIRSTATNPNRNVPIVAVTANPNKEQCMNAGMTDYLFKPVVLDELERILNLYLRKPLKNQAS